MLWDVWFGVPRPLAQPAPVLGAHLGAHGQRRGPLPSSVWTRHGAVKQGKSGGSVGTADQGRGKGSREGKMGRGGRGRTRGGERPMGTTAYGGQGSKGRAGSGDRPIGAVSYRPKHTTASCQAPRRAQHHAHVYASARLHVHFRIHWCTCRPVRPSPCPAFHPGSRSDPSAPTKMHRICHYDALLPKARSKRPASVKLDESASSRTARDVRCRALACCCCCS